jgi:hypothetical protein
MRVTVTRRRTRAAGRPTGTSKSGPLPRAAIYWAASMRRHAHTGRARCGLGVAPSRLPIVDETIRAQRVFLGCPQPARPTFLVRPARLFAATPSRRALCAVRSMTAPSRFLRRRLVLDRVPRFRRPRESRRPADPGSVATIVGATGGAQGRASTTVAVVWLTACAGCGETLVWDAHPPSVTTSRTVNTPAPPPMPLNTAPWLSDLPRCTTPPPASEPTWTVLGDVDGDGRPDSLQTTCASEPSADKCAMRLCLRAPDGSLANAAAWTAPVAQTATGLANLPPRDFEAQSTSTDAPTCVVGRRFTWRTGGYVGTADRRCTCDRTTPTLPRGCLWAL